MDEQNLPSKILSKEQARIPLIMGGICEKYARYELQDQGYWVCHTKIQRKKQDCLNKFYIQNLLNGYKGNKEELLGLLNENLTGIPDLICAKEGIISFVEVKSNNSSLRPEQEKVHELLKEKGFDVKIMRYAVDFNISKIE